MCIDGPDIDYQWMHQKPASFFSWDRSLEQFSVRWWKQSTRFVRTRLRNPCDQTSNILDVLEHVADPELRRSPTIWWLVAATASTAPAAKTRQHESNATVTNNRFAKTWHPRGGVLGSDGAGVLRIRQRVHRQRLGRLQHAAAASNSRQADPGFVPDRQAHRGRDPEAPHDAGVATDDARLQPRSDVPELGSVQHDRVLDLVPRSGRLRRSRSRAPLRVEIRALADDRRAADDRVLEPRGRIPHDRPWSSHPGTQTSTSATGRRASAGCSRAARRWPP